MQLQVEPQATARAGWVSVRRLVPAAFVAQTLASLGVWFIVNDESREGAWSTADFGQWLAMSLLWTVLAAVISGLAMRRWTVAAAATAGCTLAVVSGCTLFVGYAVLNSN